MFVTDQTNRATLLYAAAAPVAKPAASGSCASWSGRGTWPSTGGSSVSRSA